jgi:hypothetical protein
VTIGVTLERDAFECSVISMGTGAIGQRSLRGVTQGDKPLKLRCPQMIGRI